MEEPRVDVPSVSVPGENVRGPAGLLVQIDSVDATYRHDSDHPAVGLCELDVTYRSVTTLETRVSTSPGPSDGRVLVVNVTSESRVPVPLYKESVDDTGCDHRTKLSSSVWPTWVSSVPIVRVHDMPYSPTARVLLLGDKYDEIVPVSPPSTVSPHTLTSAGSKSTNSQLNLHPALSEPLELCHRTVRLPDSAIIGAGTPTPLL